MRVSDKAIVLQSIKHGDRKFIVKLFTKQNGFVTSFCTVGKNPSAKIKFASIHPLNLINAELIIRHNKEINLLNEASVYYLFHQVNSSIQKLSIAQFVNEVLIKCLQNQQSNPELFSFLEFCLIFLNEDDKNYINLHLYFLLELTKHLGIEPQNNFSETECFFNFKEGIFSEQTLATPFGLSQADSQLFSEFLKENPLQTNYSNNQRNFLVGTLLNYYRNHVPNFGELKSLEVLRAVFTD